MTLRFMLDTNICIYIMKATPGALMDRFNAEADRLCISSVSLGELHFGIEKGAPEGRDENAEGLRRFVNRLQVLGFEARAAAAFGRLRAELKRAGTPCGPYDMLIGAHARSLDLTLVTNNRREFDRMPGVRVENWV